MEATPTGHLARDPVWWQWRYRASPRSHRRQARRRVACDGIDSLALNALGIRDFCLSRIHAPERIMDLMGTLSRAEAYAKYSDDLVRFATALAGPHDALDLVSDAMVHVLWSPSWDRVRNERAYLYQAVLNEARQKYRRTMRRRALEAKAAVAAGYTDDPNIHPEVLSAVGRLSPRQRAAVFLAYWEDLSVAEIARRLGLTRSTVHRHLDRGQRRLRMMLDD